VKPTFLRISFLAAAIAGLAAPVLAEDIDLFTSTGSNAQNPNIVIMIDNSANWDSNAQHWTCPSFSPCKQGQSELRAIRRVLDEVSDKLNLGLMLFTPGPGSTPSGSYVRFHVRGMNAANKAAYKELIGQDASCVDGPNSLTGSPNCILKNFSTPGEKVGTSKTDYSAGLFEVFKYFGGYTDPAHAHADQGMTPIDASHFGALRYARIPGGPDANFDAAAYNGANQTGYNPPINADGSNSCAKNFLVFIGNGYPVQDSPASLLTGVNGNATQLQVQTYNTTTTTTTQTLGTDATCTSPATCAANAPGTFPGFDSYTCTGGTPQAPTTDLGIFPNCDTNNACVTYATNNFGGHVSYSCSGGTTTPVGSGTGTDRACETQAACNGRTATILPGFTSYGACGGGSTGAGVTQSAADPTATESRASCVSRARTTFPGYNSYSCTGGTAGAASTVVIGDSGLVCETQAACSARMTTANPGHDSVFCVGVSAPGAPANSGSIGPFALGTDAVCHNASQCASGVVIPAGSNLISPSCSGGSTTGCVGGKLINQTQQASCAGGSGAAAVMARWQVKATDTPVTNQTMNATGCNQLANQTFTAFNTCLSGQRMQATDSCIQGQNITGTKTTSTVTPGAVASLGNFADEWARYLYTTDANQVLGQQNITTYTIDVYKDAQDANETALLQSMAKYGGGRYFQATNEDAILNALRQILVEIQAVNSVFASASLPINATNRSQNENQVFIGMFRPDEKAQPKWYGNLKRYQIAIFGGDAKLADSQGNEAISATTGFIQACAQSFYTTDNGANYWSFSPASAGTCTSVPNSSNNDLPDGGVVEKGSAAEVLRKGNSTTAAAPFTTAARHMKTCPSSPCTSLVDFTTANPSQAQTGASSAAEHTSIVNFTLGQDVLDENGNANTTEPRPTIHGDIAHSRPLPVNYGDSRGVVVYYGSNDGAFHATKGSGITIPPAVQPSPTPQDGTELWSFIAPEHFGKLRRLLLNTPIISYPNLPAGVTGVPKDYFFDGSVGLYQTFKKDPVTNADTGVADLVWLFPSMRRGGRMLYAFDVSDPTAPALKWVNGCPNVGNDTGCTAGMSGMGQTWSVPAVAFVKGYNSGTKPLVIVGGGYDSCEDTDNATTSCTATSKGNHVYIFDADTGALQKSFDTDRAVPADVTLIDRDFDGNVDFVYVVDTGGALYRIDLVDPTSMTALGPSLWTMSKIAATTGSSRKFVFGPAALGTGNQVFLAMGSGDRERPLLQNYPYSTPVQNRFYMFIDSFPASGTVDLDGSTMSNFTSSTGCDTKLDGAKNGWFMDLPDRGEQTVTSSVIFGGTVFFSTNHAVQTPPNSCDLNLGIAKGYAVNLLNASGVIGSGSTCGGARNGVFTGGGLPPSPVVGTVPVKMADGTTKAISVLIGGINLDTGTGSTIGAQQPPVPIRQIRSRVYWYPHGDK